MKLLSATLALIAALALLVYTNPTMDDFSGYVRQEMVREAKNQDEPSQSITAALGGVAGFFISNATTRKNYVFFSVFQSELGAKQKRCIGLLGNFFGCKDLVSTEQNSGH